MLEDGASPHSANQPLLAGGTREFVGLDAARLTFRGDVWIAFRGLFRRREVLESGIRLERSQHVPVSDIYWVLRVALESSLVFSAETATTKRFYSGSTSSRWEDPARGAGHRETLAVLPAYGPRGDHRSGHVRAWIHRPGHCDDSCRGSAARLATRCSPPCIANQAPARRATAPKGRSRSISVLVPRGVTSGVARPGVGAARA